MCEHSDGKTAKVFVISQPMARLSFLEQSDRKSSIVVWSSQLSGRRAMHIDGTADQSPKTQTSMYF